MKKFISLILSGILFLGPTASFASDILSSVCKDLGSEEYGIVIDETKKTMLTNKEFNRECELTKEVQGACIKWESISENFAIDPEEKVAFRSENHGGALGEMLSMISAYDQLEHLWSGWKGYCEIGTKTNFDWASDPAFWAGLVASTIMEGSQKGQFLGDTGFGKGVQGFASGGSALTSYVGATAAKCLTATGMDIAKGMLSSATASESDDMCNPVDEFCGDTVSQTEESDIMTMDKQQYEDMIAEHPEYADYIIIVGEENGILSVRFKKMNELEGIDTMSQAEMEAMREKFKQMTMLIAMTMTAVKLGVCAATGGSYGGTMSGSNITNDDKSGDPKGFLSVKNGLSAGISMIPAEYLGPYGALIKAALQVLINFMYSFQDIDSCHNQDDADEQGTRHAKTCGALKFDLCHYTYSKCVENCGGAWLGMAKELVGYNYCCYDQMLTKTLVVQLKAQLGRDWSNCTGISLRDLNFVSFRQCTPNDMKAGKDGGRENVGIDYDPFESFQYKKKCIDLTEFKQYLKAQIGDDIDLEDFESVFSDIKQQKD